MDVAMADEARPLRVAVNAQLLPGGEMGGVGQFTAGLLYGLGRLSPARFLLRGDRGV